MYDRAVMLRSKFDPDSIRFEWIKRNQNREADELAKEAYYWALRSTGASKESKRTLGNNVMVRTNDT